MELLQLSPDSLLPCLHNSVNQTHSTLVASSNHPIPTSPLTSIINQSNQKNDLNLNSGVDSNSTNLAAIMLSHAEKGNIEEAQILWDVILNSSFIPSGHLVSSLMIAYAKSGNFDLISEILSQIKNRRFRWLPKIYSLAIKCFGIGGKLDYMEHTLNEMVSMDFKSIQ
ncbi:hypothetical protein RDABS01_005818 [Bienertia sinuspersici]